MFKSTVLLAVFAGLFSAQCALAAGHVIEHAGDYVWCPPEIEHWHGATPDTAMSHIAMTNNKDGKTAVWGKAVSDKEYADLSAKAIDALKK